MSILSLPVQEAQKTIFRNFEETVSHHSPEYALDLFRQLFIEDSDHSASNLSMTLYTIVMGKEQAVFEQTLTGVCEILVNTWRQQQQQDAIAALGQCLIAREQPVSTSSVFAKRLQQWLDEFARSEAFDALRATLTIENGWQQQFNDYLLVEQCWADTNTPEQQASAKVLVKKLRVQFQLELAKYVSLAQRQGASASVLKNPTALGKAVIPLIKRILLRRDRYRYESLALRFRRQVHQMRFKQFKKNLGKYLMFAMARPVKDDAFQSKFLSYLTWIDPSQNAVMTTVDQVESVCEALVDSITTRDGKKPTELFTQGIGEKDPRSLVLLLIKIVLVCPSIQLYLERRIADLIRAYARSSAEDCGAFIQFLEVFRVAFAVYVGEQEYTLVKIDGSSDADQSKGVNFSDYRIFTQKRVVKKPPKKSSSITVGWLDSTIPSSSLDPSIA